MSYKVWCGDEGEHDGSAKTFSHRSDLPPWSTDARDAATMYAEHCHSERGGWEWSWPCDFFVRDMETGTVQRFEVERETVPEFHAGRGVEVKAGPHDHENLPLDDECPCGHPFGFTGPCVKAPGWGTPCKCGVVAEGASS